MAPEVLVLGASGFLGQHVVDALRAEGVEPRCARRARSNVLGLRARRALLVTADLDDPASMVAAMAGCDVVIHAAAHYPRASTDRSATLALGLRQSAAVLAAARRARVARLVYVSSTATVAPGLGGPSSEADLFPNAPGFGVYHDLKWWMERQFLDASDLDVRVALPSGCIGPGDLRLGTCALLVAAARGDLPQLPDGLVSLVDPRDAATGIARLAVRADAPRRVILSQSTVQLASLLRSITRRYGTPDPGPPLGADAARTLADQAEREAIVARTRPRISREIVDLIVHGVPVLGQLACAALGVHYRPFSTSLIDFEAWAARLGFLPPLPEAAP